MKKQLFSVSMMALLLLTLVFSFFPFTETDALPNKGCYKTEETTICSHVCGSGGTNLVQRINCYVLEQYSYRECSPCPQIGVWDCRGCVNKD